jgi:hypothetical protein
MNRPNRDGASVPTDPVTLQRLGSDWLLGYGLKLPAGFQDTHLGRIGRNR